MLLAVQRFLIQSSERLRANCTESVMVTDVSQYERRYSKMRDAMISSCQRIYSECDEQVCRWQLRTLEGLPQARQEASNLEMRRATPTKQEELQPLSSTKLLRSNELEEPVGGLKPGFL